MLRKTMASNAAWLMADRAIRLGGGLLVGVWMARYLGPADFGLLNYTVAFSALFGILATLGLDGIVVREMVKSHAPPHAILGTAFRLRVFGALIGLAVSTGLAAIIGTTPTGVAMVALGSAVYLSQSLYVIDWYYQAQQNNRPSVMAQNFGFLISAGLKALMIVMKMPVMAFALCNLAEAVIASIVMFTLYRRHCGHDGWTFDSVIARRLLRESWPLILSGLAFMIYVRVDQVMIGRMLGDAAVGVYSAAIRISEVWNMIPVIVVTVAFPKLLQLRAEDKGRYQAYVQTLFSVLALVSILAALATQLLGTWAVSLLYGSAYAAAGPILSISIWSSIFTSLGFASGRWLIAEEMVQFALLRNLIGVFVNIAVNLVMIPKYGAIGAAIGTLISYIFANLLSYLTNRRLHPLFWLNIKALLFFGLLPTRRSNA